eukprot:1227932-Prymnesium_polylepis.1
MPHRVAPQNPRSPAVGWAPAASQQHWRRHRARTARGAHSGSRKGAGGTGPRAACSRAVHRALRPYFTPHAGTMGGAAGGVPQDSAAG